MRWSRLCALRGTVTLQISASMIVHSDSSTVWLCAWTVGSRSHSPCPRSLRGLWSNPPMHIVLQSIGSLWKYALVLRTCITALLCGAKQNCECLQASDIWCTLLTWQRQEKHILQLGSKHYRKPGATLPSWQEVPWRRIAVVPVWAWVWSSDQTRPDPETPRSEIPR